VNASLRNLASPEVGYFLMATLNVLKRAVHKALADGRVTSTEAAGVARLARQGGASRVERRFLSSAVRAQVDRFDAGAQSRLHAVGARWTATGNDPWGSREPGQRGGDGVFERSPEAFKAHFPWAVL